MPYGSRFEEDSQSVISYCSDLKTEQFYLDKTKSEMDLEDEEYGCCPMPFSHFLFGRETGIIGNRTYALPAGWSLDPSTGEVSGIRPCCRPDDCNQNEYCGLVRNPATMSLVYSKTSCGERTEFDGIDGNSGKTPEIPESPGKIQENPRWIRKIPKKKVFKEKRWFNLGKTRKIPSYPGKNPENLGKSAEKNPEFRRNHECSGKNSGKKPRKTPKIPEKHPDPRGTLIKKTGKPVENLAKTSGINRKKSSKILGKNHRKPLWEIPQKSRKTSENPQKKNPKTSGKIPKNPHPDIDYDSLGITKSMVTDQQLCQTNEDCFNTTHYCEYGKEGGPIKICTPMIGKTIHSIGAKDAFLIHGQGCPHDRRCDEKGKPWFSYRCESPDPIMPDEGKVCVGYEIICSDSALYQHGTNFGCKSNFDCLEGFPKSDKIHTPLCIQNPFPGNNKKERTACCYVLASLSDCIRRRESDTISEMKSCTYHLDIHLYGLPPLRSSMCTSNEECQELADDMTSKSKKRDVYLGRCMPETVDNYGKCCIADISSYCSVGKSLIPPQKCSNHTECEFSETTKNWCGDEGYCCEDFKNEESWLCPDGETIRIHQPKCEVKAGDEEGNWCENKAGYCVMGRCCPAVKPSGDFIHLFAESPWYYEDLNCTDTIDLPPKMDMVYCDPIRHVVTRASRGDWMNSRTVAAFYTYCSSNDNCTDISSSLVCVQEKDGLNRCHSYYDRSIKWYPFVVPTAFFVVLLLIFVFYWRKDLKYEAIEQKEVYY
ncbi:hypothetical protein CAEBREN_15295 [Caenorhabditis brenneri]|uniref:Domain of unknown function DX domain-containing protein n=1 Tax=Caenorhabditis brenneri TaxID=135651 RepID=G0NDI2_CAEBE|nr:hypothetical protein CAEBREN_15295 [Caenorhabditis brenneri]